MRILAIERAVRGVSTDRFTRELLESEAEHAWRLHQAGLIRELYFRADRHDAVLVLEAASVDEARAGLAGLPLVEAGLIDFELIPLRAYDGFARLFRDAT